MILTKKYNFKHKKQGGQVMILSVMFFVSITLTVISGIVSPAVREFKISSDAIRSKQSLFLSESGVEDAYYRSKNLMAIDTPEVLYLNGNSVSTTIDTSVADQKIITSTGSVSSRQRKSQITLLSSDGVSFQYEIQVGDGGIQLYGDSGLAGGIFTNGSIYGYSTDPNKNLIQGDVVSAGTGGNAYIHGIRTPFSARSYSIGHSIVGTDAYYQSANNLTAGTYHPNSGYPAQIPMPVEDEAIAAWEATAQAAGSIGTCSSGAYTITTSITIGPGKVNCGILRIRNNAVVTLAGPVWVTGSIRIDNNAYFIASSSLGTTSVPLIADKPSYSSSDSQILIDTTHTSSPPVGTSYVMLVSKHSGTSMPAISVKNSSSPYVLPYILYAAEGTVQFGDIISGTADMNIRTISAKKLAVHPNTVLGFTAGAQSLTFPLYTWSTSVWKEIQ